MKFKNGQYVKYGLPQHSGIGMIMGKATMEQPVIGSNWILKDMSNNFPNEHYPFECFAAFDNQLQEIE